LGKIDKLKQELLYYRTKKGSNNSFMPPSQDPYRVVRTESLRQASGRRQGGQLGHAVSTLGMTTAPTEIIEHHPFYCQCCGSELSGINSEFIGKRQVIDIPPIRPTMNKYP
jgi:hypothetical protein